MANIPSILPEDIELDGNAQLWDVMRAATRAKEAHPEASLLPAMLILKCNEVVAKVYPSTEKSRTLLVHSCSGIHEISLNWYDLVVMLYRTSALTLQKVEGTTVIFLGERTTEAGQAMICAMKWTARQFLQLPPRGARFPETRDSIAQPFYFQNEKICWLSEITSALQLS